MPDRREFLAWTLASGSALSPAGVIALAADDPAKNDAPPKEKAAEKPATAMVPADDPEELWLARVKQAYPSDKLTEEAIKEIQSDIARYLAASKVLSTFPLENGDAPATWFRAAPLADS